MIKEYIRYRKSLIYLYLGMLIVFPLVHFLDNLPIFPLAYSIFIITFVLLVCMVTDYIKFTHKLKYLKEINRQLSLDKHLLPEARHQLEAEYHEMISNLYDIIREHVESIQKANTEQVEYYTMWVHQIKTPISAMRLALQSSPSTVSTDLLEQELFKIEQYVELALQYSKMTDLSTDLVIRRYNLEEIVNQCIRKYAPLFIYKKLYVQIEEFHAEVITDSKWLAFVLEQLFGNAIKYTNRGGIRISCENNSLQINDTGIGIREEDIERIFDKGFTGYNGRIDKKASGIGLYLSKKVADALAIRISIVSKVGEGTTASIIFSEENIELSS